MFYKRRLQSINFKTSAFIFGPRMTGKTTLLRALKTDAYFDLLDPQLELEYKTNPVLFWQQLEGLKKGAHIIVDEAQKIPMLLNYVQMAMDKLDQKFLLSGSSSRKLKRGAANLLGGRALDLRLHPLITSEIGDDFLINTALEYGTLPKIYTLTGQKQFALAKGHLKSYVSTYLKEEIQAEALIRNLGAFNRFLSIAAASNAQVIEFANISRECSVPASTVKEYFQIIEDTLLGFFLWPYGHSERKKARPKLYFFDCGVVRAISDRLNDIPTPAEKGYLFETWLVNELLRIRDYLGKEHEFSFWRNRDLEVDIIISKNNKPILGIECKSGKTDIGGFTIKGFRAQFGKTPLIVASLLDKTRRVANGVEVLPWQEVILRYQSL